ncbi:MAG: ATP-binding protein [bacterium]|nr:ATP-binding protein [bacterium]
MNTTRARNNLSTSPLSRKGRTRTIFNKPRESKHLVDKKEIQGQQELLYALEKVSHVLTVEVQLQKILEDMATIVAKTLGAKWVNFWELTPDKKATYIAAAYGMQQSYIEHSRTHPIKIGKAWIGRAIKSGRAWSTNDILTDPNFVADLGPAWGKAIKKQDYRALLCVPTISKRGPIGGMCVYYPDVHEFSDFEMRLVTVAANQAATSITNAQIFNELATERNNTLAMLNSLSDGLIMYDLENNITAFNPRAEELLWIQKKLVLGKDLRTIHATGTEKHMIKNLKEISGLRLGEFQSAEFKMTDPQRITLEVTHLPVRDPRDQKIGSIRILHDITAAKEAEELKSSFITIASHQLRTPLSGIKWSLSTLQSKDLGTLTAEQANLLRKTAEANDRLIALVSDLLDASRIEEGRFGYKFRNVDLQLLVNETLQDLPSIIENKKEVRVSFHKAEQKLQTISADPNKLKMAISNVIDNAIKYTRKGSIDISFHQGSSSIALDVKDPGIGIPKDQQKFIFTKFFRARNAVHAQTEGSGLGLWIANEIVKRHNGVILFESEEDKGTTFTLQFPILTKDMPKGAYEGE